MIALHSIYVFSGSLTHVLRSTVPQVTRLMWDALENQRPAAWRVVFKGLSLLEHLIKNGSERCVDDARNHSHTLKSLHQFNYYEGTVDRGHGVREKSKQIAEIMGDDERIREERQKAKKLRDRFGGTGSTASGGGGGQYTGYGNDSSGWSGSGGGGGYGDSGLGSGRSSGGNGYGDSDTGKFSGRYSDDSAVRAGGAGENSNAASGPTFATIPDVAPKKKKKKKKADAAVISTTPGNFDSHTNKTFNPKCHTNPDVFPQKLISSRLTLLYQLLLGPTPMSLTMDSMLSIPPPLPPPSQIHLL